MAEHPPKPIEEFSYATAEDPRLRRLLIRAVERMTGQPRLKRLYEEYRKEMRGNESFWATAIRKLQLTVHVNEDALADVPRETGQGSSASAHPQLHSTSPGSLTP